MLGSSSVGLPVLVDSLPRSKESVSSNDICVFSSKEVAGRFIRVQFAKRFKKPTCTPPAGPPRGETRHKLYVSNLAWKMRSNNLREFFSVNFNPVSVRVVFDSPGRSAGYGFVSFATKEEAESAISQLDGKKAVKRKANFEKSKKLKETLRANMKEGSETREEKISALV